MKKLILYILLLLPLFLKAQTTPVSPSQMNQVTWYYEPSTTLKWGFNATRGWFFIPDSAKVRHWTGGSGDTISFTRNFKNTGTVTNAVIDLADTIHTKFIHADSAYTLRINSKKAWAPYYGVFNMAHNVGIRSDDNIHNLLLYNNIYAVGNTNNDWKYAENGLGAYLYMGINASLTFANSLRGTAGASATINTRLMIDSLGHTYLYGLRDTSTSDSIVAYHNGQLYKMPGTGGGGSFLPLTLTGDATVTVDPHTLTFSADSGSGNTQVAINHQFFDANAVYTPTGESADITVQNAEDIVQANMTYNDGSGNIKQINVTNQLPGIPVFDNIDHIGFVADASIDTANMTTNPKAYVTSEWVMGKIAGGSGSFVPVSTGTSPVFNAILNDGVNGISIGTGNGSRGYQLYMNQSDTAFFGTFRSTSSKRIGLHIDSLNAFFVNTENHKPLKYEGVSFGLLTDSSLVPKRYVDSLTAGGGSGAVVLNPPADQTVDISTNSTIFQGDGHVFGVNGYLTISPQALQSFYTDTATAYTAFLTVTPAGNGLQYGINQSIGGAPNEQSMSIDTFRGTFWKDTRFHRGIDLQGVNFSAFRDSTLIPKAYAIHLIDSLSSGGGTTTHPLTLGYGILGTSFDGSTAVTAKVDSSVIQTIANFFPKADTRYYTKTASDARYEVPLTFTSGVARTSNTVKADTSILAPKAYVNNFLPKASAASTYAPLISPTFTGTVTIPNGGVFGTPTSMTATNVTGLPLTTGVTGILPYANGGTNANTSWTQGSIFFAGSSALAQNNSDLFWDNSNNRVGLMTSAPTHTLTLGSTSTGFVFYNTTDQITNYERILGSWISNTFTLTTQNNGTGTLRDFTLGGSILRLQGNGATRLMIQGSNIIGSVNAGSSITSGGLSTFGVTGTNTNSSGIAFSESILQTINQTSTGASTALWISPFYQTTGSGPQLLIDAGTNSSANGGGTHTSKFKVDNTGATTIGATLQLHGYTVSTLPTPSIGMTAYVTDALAPAVGVTVASGGSAKAMVWYNGTNWTVTGI